MSWSPIEPRLYFSKVLGVGAFFVGENSVALSAISSSAILVSASTKIEVGKPHLLLYLTLILADLVLMAS